MGVVVKHNTCTLFRLHSLLNTGNMSYFDLAVIEYYHFIDYATKDELANPATWHPLHTVDYFRRRLNDVRRYLLDTVTTAADLDMVESILDEVCEELNMIATWEELVDEYVFHGCNFDSFTSSLAGIYEDIEG